MKLLLDQGLPRSATALLCEAGIDTVHVAEIGLSAADDTDILKSAPRARAHQLWREETLGTSDRLEPSA